MDENRNLLQNPHDTGLQNFCIQWECIRRMLQFLAGEVINSPLEIAAILMLCPTANAGGKSGNNCKTYRHAIECKIYAQVPEVIYRQEQYLKYHVVYLFFQIDLICLMWKSSA